MLNIDFIETEKNREQDLFVAKQQIKEYKNEIVGLLTMLEQGVEERKVKLVEYTALVNNLKAESAPEELINMWESTIEKIRLSIINSEKEIQKRWSIVFTSDSIATV